MLKLETVADLAALHGQYESDWLEAKGLNPITGSMRKTELLVKCIQSFLNGAAAQSLIVLGLGEIATGRVDGMSPKPIKFPCKIDGMSFEPRDFAEYRDHLMKMVRSSTDEYIEGLVRFERMACESGEIIVIRLAQSRFRPHKNLSTGKFYIRRAEGITDEMSTREIEQAFVDRRLRLAEESRGLLGSVSPNQTPAARSLAQILAVLESGAFCELKPRGHHTEKREVRLMAGPQMRLIVRPDKPLNFGSYSELSERIDRRGLQVFGRSYSRWSSLNEYGAVLFQEAHDQPGQAFNLTQLTKQGELIGIDRFLLREAREIEGRPVAGFFPSHALEEEFAKGLANFSAWLAAEGVQSLGVTVSVNGVKGFPLAVDQSKFFHKYIGSCVLNDVSYDVNVRIGQNAPHAALKPFFKDIWDACGEKRPDWLDGVLRLPAWENQ